MENDNQLTVETSRQFDVPVEELFTAWNEEEKLKQWWKPLGNQLEKVDNDLQPGGEVRYTCTDNALIISGKYEEVKQNEELIYSWNWQFPDDEVKNASYKLRVHFTSEEGGSKIHVIQEPQNQQEKLHPNEHGWDQGLSNLADFLNGHTAEESDHDDQKQLKPEEAGYRERPEQQKVGGG